jgi:hypothetical protein
MLSFIAPLGFKSELRSTEYWTSTCLHIHLTGTQRKGHQKANTLHILHFIVTCEQSVGLTYVLYGGPIWVYSYTRQHRPQTLLYPMSVFSL